MPQMHNYGNVIEVVPGVALPKVSVAVTVTGNV
jgi:hypothetical protein